MDDKSLINSLIDERKKVNTQANNLKNVYEKIAKDNVDVAKTIGELKSIAKDSAKNIDEKLKQTLDSTKNIESNSNNTAKYTEETRDLLKDSSKKGEKQEASEEKFSEITIQSDLYKLIGLIPMLTNSILGLKTTFEKKIGALISVTNNLPKNLSKVVSKSPELEPKGENLTSTKTTKPNESTALTTPKINIGDISGEKAINSLSSIFENIAKINVIGTYANVKLMPIVTNELAKIINSFSNLNAFSKESRKTIGTFNSITESLKIISEIQLSKLAINVYGLKKVMPIISDILFDFTEKLKNTKLKLGETITDFKNFLSYLEDIKVAKLFVLSKLLPGITESFTKSVNNLSEINQSSFKKVKDINPFINLIKDLGKVSVLRIAVLGKLLPGITESFTKSVNNLNEIDKNSFKKVKDVNPFVNLINDLGKVSVLRIAILSKLLPGITKSLVNSINPLEKVNDDALGKIDTISEKFLPFLDDIIKRVSKIGTSLIKMAFAVGLLAGSLYLMSKIDAANLLLVSVSTLAVSGALTMLSKINAASALRGIGVVAAAGVAMTALAFAMTMFQGINIGTFFMAIGALAALTGAAILLSKFAGQALIGAAAIMALSVAIIPLAFAMKMLEGITWESLGIAAAALVGLAAAAFGLSFIAPAIFIGSLAIAALGASLLPLAMSLNMLSSVDPGILLDISTSLAIFSASILPLVLMSPLFAILSFALIPFTASLFALSKLGGGLSGSSEFFTNLTNFVKAVPADEIWNISKAITALSASMAAFAGAELGASLTGAFSGLVSFFSGEKSPIEKLKEIASLTTLSDIGPAIKSLSEGLYNIGQLKSGAFAAINEFPWDKIKSAAAEITAGSTLQIVQVTNGSDIRTQTLNETGSTMSGTGQTIINNVVTNTGGSTTNTNISNVSSNVRSSPIISPPRNLEY